MLIARGLTAIGSCFWEHLALLPLKVSKSLLAEACLVEEQA
jgi:hypothetical protein